MDNNAGGLTVSEAAPETPFKDALTVVVPAATAVASPVTPTVATLIADELHVTSLLRFSLVPLLYVPVAVNCWELPDAIDGVAGVTAMETKGGVTSSKVEAEMEPEAARIAADPVAMPVARPFGVVLLTTATLGAEELQVTD
jgi:hypothetical protein